MRKCKECRQLDYELLSPWERFTNWLFIRVNTIFFTDNFEDVKMQKYTQGFGDGTTDGFKVARKNFEKDIEILRLTQQKPPENDLSQRLNDLLSNVDLHKIVTFDKTNRLIYIGGKQVEPGRLASLKAEAESLIQMEIWALLQETPKELAMRSMFIEGDSLENMKKGRSILYTLSTQKNIIDVLKK